MPDNDFWIGQEQIPVDLSLLLTYSNDEDYWYAPGEYALRVYTVDTLNTNFGRPCFALGERTSDPEMEDVSGAIENTLHELLDSGATPEDVYRIMGLVKESELSPETKEADSYLPIDLGYCIDGNIVSYEAVPESVATVPENVDYPRYAEAMESHVPLPIATQIAKHDFSHRQADILMEAARSPHVSPETLETTLIAGIKPDGTGNYGGREVETNMVLSVYSRQNFIRYFALLRDMDAFVFVSGKKIEALEDLSGLPLAGNCSGLDIDRILQRPKCLG